MPKEAVPVNSYSGRMVCVNGERIPLEDWLEQNPPGPKPEPKPEPEPLVAETEEEVVEEEKPLEEMTVQGLRKKAKEKNIPIPQGVTRKGDILEVLKEKWRES